MTLYSIKGKYNAGSTSVKTGHMTIYINTMTNPEEDFNRFMAEFISVEFHELGHKYDGLEECSEFYQNMTYRMIEYLEEIEHYVF